MAAPIRSSLTKQLQSILKDTRIGSNGHILLSHQRELVKKRFCVLSPSSLNFAQNRNIASFSHGTDQHHIDASRTNNTFLSFNPRTCVLYIPSRLKGHSKWQNIASRKKSQDSKKNVQTQRMLNLLGAAIKSGGNCNPKTNNALANAVETAKKANIPKATIDGFIRKMEEKGKTCSDYQLLIQGPHGSYFVVQGYTTAMSKFTSDINRLIKKQPLKISEPGQLAMIFDYKGEVIIEKPEGKDLEEIAITCDAEEFVEENDDDGKVNVKFICDGDAVMGLKKNLETEGYEIQGFDTVYIPKIPLELTDEEFQDVNRMSEKLEEYADLSNYYLNI